MDGVSAGSLYFELGVREQDLTALEQRIARLGQALSEKLNPKQPTKGGYSGLIKELDQLQAKLREGKVSQTEFDDGLEKLKNKATPTTTELKKLANETRGLRNEWQATGQNTKQVVADLSRVRDEALRLANTVERGTAEWAQYRVVARQAQATIDGIEGRMSRLGLASQVQLGVQQQLSSSLRSLGPVGSIAAGGLDSMGFAAGGASAGMLALGAGVAAVGVGVSAMVRRGLPLVESMQRSFAVLRTSGVEDLGAIEDAIRELQETQRTSAGAFNRAELAQGVAELVKAGLDASEALELLGTTTKIAAAEQLDLNAVSQLVLTNLRQYRLDMSEAGRVGDVLAAGALAARGGIQGLSLGFRTVGPLAQAAGFSFEETTALLVQLDNAGLDFADEGGTALRSTIAQLIDPTAKARGVLEGLGISVEDAGGKAKTGKELLFELSAALKSSEQAAAQAAQIFDTRAITAILNLDEAVLELAADLEDSEGVLDGYADTMSDTLPAAKDRAKAALDDLATTFSETVAPAIETGYNWLTAFAGALDDLLEASQGSTGDQLAFVSKNIDILEAQIARLEARGPNFLEGLAGVDLGKLRADLAAYREEYARLLRLRDSESNSPLLSGPLLSAEGDSGDTDSGAGNEGGPTAEQIETVADLTAQIEALEAQKQQLAKTDIEGARAINAQIDALTKQRDAILNAGRASAQRGRAEKTAAEQGTEAINKYFASLNDLNTSRALGLIADDQEALESQFKTTDAAIRALVPLYSGLTTEQKALLESLIVDADVLKAKLAEVASNTLSARLQGAQGFVEKLEGFLSAGILEPDEVATQLSEALEKVGNEIAELGPLDSEEKVAKFLNLLSIKKLLEGALDDVFGKEREVVVQLKVETLDISEAALTAWQAEMRRRAAELGATELFPAIEAGNIAGVESAIQVIDSLNSATERGAEEAEARAEAERLLNNALAQRESILSSLASVEERRIADQTEKQLRGQASRLGAFGLLPSIGVDNDAVAAGLDIINQLNSATERGAEAAENRAEAERLINNALANRDQLLSSLRLTEATPEDFSTTLSGLNAASQELYLQERALEDANEAASDFSTTLARLNQISAFEGRQQAARADAEALEDYQDVLDELAGMLEEFPVLSGALEQLAQATGLTLDPLDVLEQQIDALEPSADLSQEQIDALRLALELLRKESANQEGLKQLVETLGKVSGALKTIGGAAEGPLAGVLTGLGEMVDIGIKIASGDYLGAAVDFISGLVGALTAASKAAQKLKDDLEATTEGFEGFIDPAAIAREFTSSTTEIVDWFLFIPIYGEVLNKDEIGLEITESVVNGLASGLRSGIDRFLETGNIEDLEFGIQQGIYQGAIDAMFKAIVEQGVIQEILGPQLLELSKAIAEGYRTGDYSRAEQIMGDLQRIIPELAAQLAPIFEGFGRFRPNSSAPEGSIADYEQQLAEAREKFRNAVSDTERRALQAEIERLERVLRGLQGQEDAADTADDSLTFDLPPAIQFAVATPLVEASHRIYDAAELIHETFSGAGLPASPGSSLGMPAAYQAALEAHRQAMTEHSQELRAHRQALAEGMTVRAEAVFTEPRRRSPTEAYRA